MTPRKKLIICLVANVGLLATIITMSIVFADSNSTYWRFGPSNELLLISIRINTYAKYAAMLIFIAALQITRVFVEELGMPILGFSVYNPDAKVITVFSKNELQFFANSMFFVTGLRNVFMILGRNL